MEREHRDLDGESQGKGPKEPVLSPDRNSEFVELFKRIDKPGRLAALEVLVVDSPIANLIREAKTHQIYSLMQAGQKFGMQTMNQALLQAVTDRALSPVDALERSTDRPELESMFEKVLRSAA